MSDNSNLLSMGWNELVALKRKIASELKESTDKIVDIDRNQIHSITSNIRQHKSAYDAAAERLKQVRLEINKHNSNLLEVSEKMSQSKNFLSIMEERLPKETEEELREIVSTSRMLIDNREFKGEREKSEILSRIKDASMKMEAVKATNAIREQYRVLDEESCRIGESVSNLNAESDALRSKMAQENAELDKLHSSKRALIVEREKFLAAYTIIAKRFEEINTRLDEMSAMRKKQREEYGYNLPSDALFKVKETARKKLESGSKLSFDELKLLYSEKD